MARTARYTLTTTPQQMDVADDDSIAFRDLTVFPQASGTIVICDDDTTDPTTEGARVTVTTATPLVWDRISGSEDVWLAVASGTLDVDVAETGVS